jgi:hypothetical protein
MSKKIKKMYAVTMNGIQEVKTVGELFDILGEQFIIAKLPFSGEIYNCIVHYSTGMRTAIPEKKPIKKMIQEETKHLERWLTPEKMKISVSQYSVLNHL